MKNIYEIWGNLIRSKRKELGYTQEVLAHLASVSNVYISKLERGKVNPSCKVLEKLCGALEMDINCLFFREKIIKVYQKK